ncbi:MAG: hypothetical protein ACREK3_07720 [Gemmatimonadota bacterium]
MEHVSPPEACAEDASIVFKAGTVVDGRLYLCTQTEVLVHELPSFERRAYLSLPFFNDLHHVCPAGDNSLLVAVTGLDMVAEVTLDGQVVREWGVLGQDPWERFSRSVDYRRVLTTKPHYSHPNFLFSMNGELWVTRFEQRDAISLTPGGHRIPIELEKPHDGIVLEDRVYFTTIDGHIVVADTTTREVRKVFDLNAISKRDRDLGWCRGLAILDGRRAIVGFTRIRPTRFRENLRWLRHELGFRETRGDLSTRLVCYDLDASREDWEIDLEDSGMNCVFSIHPFGDEREG